MPGKAMVCPACQKNLHGQCANEVACVCALRQHPDMAAVPNDNSANRRLPT
jgi:hypothetical protein